MIKIVSLLFVLVMLSIRAHGQEDFNLELLAELGNDFQNNDIWGYVAHDGTEYAILGTTHGTSIISLADPYNLEEIQFIPGFPSVWRDIKSWENFVYVTTDSGEDGILIIDMAGLPTSVTWEFWRPEIIIDNISSFLNRCHNLYIDENGFCYLAGCNVNSGGPVILDVHTQAGKPIYIGTCPPQYSHDVFVRGDTLYSSEINNGIFRIIDVKDKSSPITLATQETSFRFTHNSWLSDDSKFLFTTDERANAFVDAYDISDLADIRLTDRFRPGETDGSGVIPHNVHYFNKYLVVSWYTDGLVIVDAHRPDFLVKVGAYDTWDGEHGGFRGAWGAYPWLPSGLVLVSDMSRGLMVFRPTYSRACYFEGIVTNAESGEFIDGAKIEILSTENSLEEITNFQGKFRAGFGKSDLYSIVVSKEGFRTVRIDTTIVAGQTIDLNIQLELFKNYTITVDIIDSITGMQVYSGSILFQNDSISVEASHQSSTFNIKVYDGNTTIIAGAWGYKYKVIENFNPATSNEIIIKLERGYEDCFLFDYGWQATTVNEDIYKGGWYIGVPEATYFNGVLANPPSDIDDDWGDACYVTGPWAGEDFFEFELNTYTSVVSPKIYINDYVDPVLTYQRWFFNAGGSSEPNDSLIVYIYTLDSLIVLEKVLGTTNGWSRSPEFHLKDFTDISGEMVIIFETSDVSPPFQVPSLHHIVEAGFDGFKIIDQGLTNIQEKSEVPSLIITPNPGRGRFLIQHPEGKPYSGTVDILDLTGKVIWSQLINHLTTSEVNLTANPGMYIVRLIEDTNTIYLSKIIIH